MTRGNVSINEDCGEELGELIEVNCDVFEVWKELKEIKIRDNWYDKNSKKVNETIENAILKLELAEQDLLKIKWIKMPALFDISTKLETIKYLFNLGMKSDDSTEFLIIKRWNIMIKELYNLWCDCTNEIDRVIETAIEE